MLQMVPFLLLFDYFVEDDKDDDGWVLPLDVSSFLPAVVVIPR